jgi:hypothetical protein
LLKNFFLPKEQKSLFRGVSIRFFFMASMGLTLSACVHQETPLPLTKLGFDDFPQTLDEMTPRSFGSARQHNEALLKTYPKVHKLTSADGENESAVIAKWRTPSPSSSSGAAPNASDSNSATNALAQSAAQTQNMVSNMLSSK